VAVVGEVLRDQDQLAHAALRQHLCLTHDRFRRTADGRALDVRNGAKSAGPPASIGDFEICADARLGNTQRTVFVSSYYLGLFGR